MSTGCLLVVSEAWVDAWADWANSWHLWYGVADDFG